MTDEEIQRQDQQDREVRGLRRAGHYGGSRIVQDDDVVYVEREDGSRRVVLPAALWVEAFREAHGSIFVSFARTASIRQAGRVYWWPTMRSQVKQWINGCSDCGMRKTKPKQVIPPLRSQGGGMPEGRWTLDVTGPLSATEMGNSYVIAAVDYATRYAVAVMVPSHAASDIARFDAERVVLTYGAIRELINDGAPELGGKVLDKLAELLKKITPVPHRPRLLRLGERFHIIGKDMVAMFMEEQQNDWDGWLPCALHAYNSGQHGTTSLDTTRMILGLWNEVVYDRL
ncbi:unnamed protein product [Phytophthora fragariaefolia]|uniref:Unnamed protein product n=1 Tax=Phytophthora fragariaefolia TaxID=1490495 RepID=A0A9W6U6I1_9STRA|nr:unnamed protein product [Phytophthora fragariaefolia]